MHPGCPQGVVWPHPDPLLLPAALRAGAGPPQRGASSGPRADAAGAGSAGRQAGPADRGPGEADPCGQAPAGPARQRRRPGAGGSRGQGLL